MTPSSIVQAETQAQPMDTPQNRFDKVRSALGPGTVIQGKLSFDTPVRIDGKLAGEVFSSDTLIVGPSGSIDAQIDAAHLVVMGVVRGTIKVSGKIELLAGGRIESDINTPVFTVEQGAVFNGRCSMNSKEASTIRPIQAPVKETVLAADPANAIAPESVKEVPKSPEIRVH